MNILETSKEDENFNGGQEVTASTTVISMVNGMVGGTALVFPTVGLASGWVNCLWGSLLIGFCLYYTAYLIITHLGRAVNMKYCVLAHFDNNYKYMSAYGIIIWVSFIPFTITYFIFAVSEINGLVGYQSNWVTAAVFIFVICSTVASRMLHWAEQMMALGIVGIVLFVIFLVWCIASAPAGPNTVPATASPFSLLAILVSSLEIHDFLAQNIIKNPRKNQNNSVVIWTFIIGGSVYLFALFGSFAIVNRPPVVHPPQVLSDYFPTGQWQVTVIQLAFSTVVLTGLPNYTIVSMVRFFQICKIDLGQKITLKQIIYIFCITIFSAFIYISGIQLQTIFVINGSIIGYLYVFIIPIWMHLKCVWRDRSSGTIEGDEEWNQQVKMNVCECEVHYRSKWTLYLETTFLVFLLVAGFGLICFNLATLAGPSSSNHPKN